MSAQPATPSAEQPVKRVYNVHEAKTHLSKLLERVEAGEEITIARSGKPVARLTAPAPGGITLGVAKGEIWISPLAFDEPDPEWEAMIDQMENGPL